MCIESDADFDLKKVVEGYRYVLWCQSRAYKTVKVTTTLTQWPAVPRAELNIAGNLLHGFGEARGIGPLVSRVTNLCRRCTYRIKPIPPYPNFFGINPK